MKTLVRSIGLLFLSVIIGCTFESDEIYFEEIDVSNLSSPSISFFDATDTIYLRDVTSLNFDTNVSGDYFGYDVLVGNDTVNSGETPSIVYINTANFSDGIYDLTLITYTKTNSSSLADRLNLEVDTSSYTRKARIDNKPVEFNVSGFSIVDSTLNVSWEPYDDFMFERIEVKERNGYDYETLYIIEDVAQTGQDIPDYKGGILNLTVTIYAKGEMHDFPLSYNYNYDLSIEDRGTDFLLSMEKSPFAGKREIEVRHYYSFEPSFHTSDPFDTYLISEGEEVALDLRRAFPTKYEFRLYGNFVEEESTYIGQQIVDTEDNRSFNLDFSLDAHIGNDEFIALENERIYNFSLSEGTSIQGFVEEGAVISDDGLHTLEVDETSIRYFSNDAVKILNEYTLESFDVEGPPMAWSISNSGIAYILTDRGGNGDPFRPVRRHSYYLIDMKEGTLITNGGHSSGPFTGGFPGSSSIVRDDVTAITSRFAAEGFYFIIKSDASNRLFYQSTNSRDSFFPSSKNYFIVFEGNELVKYTYPSIEFNSDGSSTFTESESFETTILPHSPNDILVSKNHYGYVDNESIFHIYDLDTHELLISVEVIDGIGFKLFDNYLITRIGYSFDLKTVILEY